MNLQPIEINKHDIINEWIDQQKRNSHHYVISSMLFDDAKLLSKTMAFIQTIRSHDNNILCDTLDYYYNNVNQFIIKKIWGIAFVRLEIFNGKIFKPSKSCGILKKSNNDSVYLCAIYEKNYTSTVFHCTPLYFSNLTKQIHCEVWSRGTVDGKNFQHHKTNSIISPDSYWVGPTIYRYAQASLDDIEVIIILLKILNHGHLASTIFEYMVFEIVNDHRNISSTIDMIESNDLNSNIDKNNESLTSKIEKYDQLWIKLATRVNLKRVWS